MIMLVNSSEIDNRNDKTYPHGIHIMVALNLGEQPHFPWVKPPGYTTRIITSRSLNARPVLDLGQDQMYDPIQELIRLITMDRSLSTGRRPLHDPPLRNTPTNKGDLGHLPRDSLQRRPRSEQIRPGPDALGHVGRDGNGLDLRDVAERDVVLDPAQHLASGSTGPAQGSVLVVGRGVVPGAETLFDDLLGRAGRLVVVCQGHDVRGDGGLPCLLQPWVVVGAWLVVSCDGVRGLGRLYGVEFAAPELGGMVGVSGEVVASAIRSVMRSPRASLS